MSNDLIYLIQTIYNIAFCYSVDALYQAMKYRSPREAILYSADKIEYLQYMANINQNRYCDRNSDEKNVIHAVAIPTVINETTCLQVNEVNNATGTYLVAYQQAGEWAVSGLNGFCTAKTDEDLCRILAGKTFAYPMAQWFPFSHNEVVPIARDNYLKRFYYRYWYSAEQTLLPQQWFEEFVDPYFEQREKRREAEQYEEFKKFQLARANMGW